MIVFGLRSLPRGKSRAEGWPLQAKSPLGVDRSEWGYERRTSAGPEGAVGVAHGVHGLPRTDVGCPRRAEVRPVTYMITEPCVDVLDRACIEECPVDCIYAGRRTLYIHPGVDCGACEPVCPVEAVFYEDDVPSEWSAYIRANAELLQRPRIAGRRIQGRPARPRRGPGRHRGAPACAGRVHTSGNGRRHDSHTEPARARRCSGAHRDGQVRR
jgi:NAD-dependent dihydropyrimidine dehydrogenase PreA subunit